MGVHVLRLFLVLLLSLCGQIGSEMSLEFHVKKLDLDLIVCP